MLNKLDYSYNSENSIIHRINPVVKLFGILLYLILCLLKFNNIIFICNISFVFLLILLSNVNVFKYLKIIWKLKFLLIFSYVLLIYIGMDCSSINVIFFKVIFLILYIYLFIYTTTKEDRGKGISIILNLFNLIGINISIIANFIINIFAFIEYFIDSYNELLLELEIDGVSYIDSNILNKIKLFFKNFKKIYNNSKLKIKKRKKDMGYRLYNKNIKIQYKYRNKLCVFDYTFIIFYICMLVYYVLKVR